MQILLCKYPSYISNELISPTFVDSALSARAALWKDIYHGSVLQIKNVSQTFHFYHEIWFARQLHWVFFSMATTTVRLKFNILKAYPFLCAFQQERKKKNRNQDSAIHVMLPSTDKKQQALLLNVANGFCFFDFYAIHPQINYTVLCDIRRHDIAGKVVNFHRFLKDFHFLNGWYQCLERWFKKIYDVNAGRMNMDKRFRRRKVHIFLIICKVSLEL